MSEDWKRRIGIGLLAVLALMLLVRLVPELISDIRSGVRDRRNRAYYADLTERTDEVMKKDYPEQLSKDLKHLHGSDKLDLSSIRVEYPEAEKIPAAEQLRAGSAGVLGLCWPSEFEVTIEADDALDRMSRRDTYDLMAAVKEQLAETEESVFKARLSDDMERVKEDSVVGDMWYVGFQEEAVKGPEHFCLKTKKYEYRDAWQAYSYYRNGTRFYAGPPDGEEDEPKVTPGPVYYSDEQPSSSSGRGRAPAAGFDSPRSLPDYDDNDPYDVHDYDDPEDFYYDNEDLFDDYEEAEDYYYDAWGE